MNYKKYTLLPVLCMTLICCQKSLDEKTTNEWTNQETWNHPDIAMGVLMKAYDATPSRPDSYGENFLDAATDNAATNVNDSDIAMLGNGGLTAFTNPIGIWKSAYDQFQNIHAFLKNGLRDELRYNRSNPDIDNQIKDRLRGEAYFLRAWWGMELLRMYGGKTDNGEALGYPIILDYVYESDAAQATKFHRASYQECVGQIVTDCDNAAKLLPDAYTGDDLILGKTHIGRATALTAMALKSRVMLMAASPAYQPDEITMITGMGMFTVIDESSYIERWEAAAMAANDLIKVSGFGNFYAIKPTDLADVTDVTPEEFLFRRYFNNNQLEKRNFPPFYQGIANTMPSQNLVDAFSALNSYPITDPRSNYDPQNPYDNRDARLELNVYYQGRRFGKNTTTIDVIQGGRDAMSYNHKASKTGYYLAKFIATVANMFDPIQTQNAKHYYPTMRKAEVFFNFAEAANEAWGPKEKSTCKFSAYDLIKATRKAAGITNDAYIDEVAALGKDAFRKLIQNERRLEFAFENMRFFDMRRWILPLNEPVYKVDVTIGANNDPIFSGTQANNKIVFEQRQYNNIRNYYFPIPYTEMKKNPQMKNNLGW